MAQRVMYSRRWVHSDQGHETVAKGGSMPGPKRQRQATALDTRRLARRSGDKRDKRRAFLSGSDAGWLFGPGSFSRSDGWTLIKSRWCTVRRESLFEPSLLAGTWIAPPLATPKAMEQLRQHQPSLLVAVDTSIIHHARATSAPRPTLSLLDPFVFPFRKLEDPAMSPVTQLTLRRSD